MSTSASASTSNHKKASAISSNKNAVTESSNSKTNTTNSKISATSSSKNAVTESSNSKTNTTNSKISATSSSKNAVTESSNSKTNTTNSKISATSSSKNAAIESSNSKINATSSSENTATESSNSEMNATNNSSLVSSNGSIVDSNVVNNNATLKGQTISSVLNQKTKELTLIVAGNSLPSLDTLKNATTYADQHKLTVNVKNASTLTTTSTTTLPVASDPDSGRIQFNENAAKPDATTPTSVTVATPDQITNNSQYYQDAVTNNTIANVSTYAQLGAAWVNNNINYINITGDIAYDATASSIGTRVQGNNIIINGNNHTVDIGSNVFAVSGNGSQVTNITFSNTVYREGFTTNNGNGNSFVYINNANKATINFNNITLTASVTGNNPIRAVYASNGKVIFSGKNIFNLSNEVTRAVTNIEFANNSSVALNRTSNDIRYSEFYMSTRASSSDTGYGNSITMGDGSSNTAYTYNDQSANYPAIYSRIDGMLVGDNVSWTQKGFQYFINGTQSSIDTAKFVFGQNFKLSAPVTTQPGAIRLQRTQSIVFNAGTVLDINQQANGSVINLAGSSTIQFISPKSLHLSIQDSSGNPIATNAGIISGAGTFQMNNSSVNTWIGTNSEQTSPNGDNTAKFVSLTVTGGRATLTDVAGNQGTSSILSSSTRELQTLAIPVGTINLQYVDQNGNLVATKTITTTSDNYIGQYISLATTPYAITDMPANYMWAIGNQVYTGAKSDAQSGGDSTTTADNGDSYGQANYAILPMEGTTYTYKIYMYGVANNNIQYQYVDSKTGKVISVSGVTTSGQQEAGSTNVPANYGNIINWDSKYYKITTVPSGYVYDSANTSQPTNSTVTTDSLLQTIYVTAVPQTVQITFKNSDGTTLVGTISTGGTYNGSTNLQMTYGDLFNALGLTEAGYHVSDPDAIFTFDDSNNVDA
ncbi:beta strand repeat-containing protein, partial [Lactiplantibacillus plantarum]|uniref:beta strand repeat-containing protein n=1 Tax=Lactiplantibacillus plantarum TaxID=1590 RepID=UPI0032C40A7D